MASYEEVAGDLSLIVTQEQAAGFAQNVIDEAAPTPSKTVEDLSPTVQAQLVKWMQWFGREKRPAGLPGWVQWSPRRVAHYLGMDDAYLKDLLARRAAIVGEVSTYAADAFKAHAAITALTYLEGDLTITGKEFLSVAGGAMGVRMQRPDGPTVARTKVQIETAGGTFTNTSITVKAASIPTELLTGDLITVVADGLDSVEVVLTVSEPIEA